MKSSLTRLSDLNLNDNIISEIQPGSFLELKNIKYLWLNNNKLTILKKHTFLGLENLKELTLDRNQISFLQNGTFKGLINLKELYLDGNALIRLQYHTFRELRSLEILSIGDNPVSCDELYCFLYQYDIVRFQLTWMVNFKSKLNLQKSWSTPPRLSCSDEEGGDIQLPTFKSYVTPDPRHFVPLHNPTTETGKIGHLLLVLEPGYNNLAMIFNCNVITFRSRKCKHQTLGFLRTFSIFQM